MLLILTTCFFGGMIAKFYINVYIIARANICNPCTYGTRLIYYNAGRASADVIIYRRRPAPVRYVTTQEKILKKRPVPGQLSNSPVMCKSLKSYDGSFICDHNIRRCDINVKSPNHVCPLKSQEHGHYHGKKSKLSLKVKKNCVIEPKQKVPCASFEEKCAQTRTFLI